MVRHRPPHFGGEPRRCPNTDPVREAQRPIPSDVAPATRSATSLQAVPAPPATSLASSDEARSTKRARRRVVVPRRADPAVHRRSAGAPPGRRRRRLPCPICSGNKRGVRSCSSHDCRRRQHAVADLSYRRRGARQTARRPPRRVLDGSDVPAAAGAAMPGSRLRANLPGQQRLGGACSSPASWQRRPRLLVLPAEADGSRQAAYCLRGGAKDTKASGPEPGRLLVADPQSSCGPRNRGWHLGTVGR